MSKHTPGRIRVGEPLWNEGTTKVLGLLIGMPRKDDCFMEMATLNCESSRYDRHGSPGMVPVESEFRNDATVPGEALANARRLVECWNGCIGVNPKMVRQMVDALRKLLAAWRAVKDDELVPESINDEDMWDGIETLIAKATGK